MTRIALLALIALASCGANGAPQPPTATGMTISGSADTGLARNGG